ncbi:SH3 domain-containing protein [Paracoccus sp. Z330]|uniref:SH3 domain-containing protein n=1 Tax=Paracoccus onchidii TaxID=3017813 RepID=A0ABT4ZGY8_9RHOB|nr:SH3 domain-containing protein [Paracoccus onchidii]MDB6178572.1 SH3 domain-containing protein [Paracoccus onchidii]
MFKLVILVAITLAGLYVFMESYGAGNPRAARQIEAEPERSAAQDAGRQVLIAPAPAPEPLPEVIQATSQTPEQVQTFPGPPLRRAPDHSGPSSAPAPAQAELPAATEDIMYVTGNRVNFRAGPSTNDRVIGALVLGDPVETLGPTDASWINIRDTGGRIGYMSAQFLSNTNPN